MRTATTFGMWSIGCFQEPECSRSANSHRSEQFAALMRPFLAAEGDIEAQRHLLGDLVEEIKAGERPSAESYAWLDALADEEMLLLLFEAAKLLYRPDSPIPAGAEPGSGAMC
jgi:hypothetical protein